MYVPNRLSDLCVKSRASQQPLCRVLGLLTTSFQQPLCRFTSVSATTMKVPKRVSDHWVGFEVSKRHPCRVLIVSAVSVWVPKSLSDLRVESWSSIQTLCRVLSLSVTSSHLPLLSYLLPLLSYLFPVTMRNLDYFIEPGLISNVWGIQLKSRMFPSFGWLWYKANEMTSVEYISYINSLCQALYETSRLSEYIFIKIL